MRRAGSRGHCVRHRHRRYGRAHFSDSQAAATDDFFWFQSTYFGGRLPEIAAGTRRCIAFHFWADSALFATLSFCETAAYGIVSIFRISLVALHLVAVVRMVATHLVQGLELTHEKFIDLCVLCGCDYTGSIKGIGPKKALALVRQVSVA